MTLREITVKSTERGVIWDLRGMAACRSALLGGFALTGAEGGELALPTRKDRLLLAYLARRPGQAQDRGRLGGLLWYWDDLGSIFYLAGRYADSVASFRRCSRLTS